MSDINTQETTYLKFPTKTDIHNQYYVQFDFYTFNYNDAATNLVQDVADNGVGALSGDNLELAGQILNNITNVQSQINQTAIFSIKLPTKNIPEETVAGNFDDKSVRNVATVGSVINDVQAGASGGLSELVGRLTNFGNQATRELVSDLVPGGDAVTDTLDYSARRAFNEQMRTMYTGPQKRSYSMEFPLMAKNIGDSRQLAQIKKRFMAYASPSNGSIEGGEEPANWRYPKLVKFQFIRVNYDSQGNPISDLDSDQNVIDTLFSSKFCFIENVTFNANGENGYREFVDTDGNLGISSATLSISLKEIEIFTQGDFIPANDNA